jgi:hypothetical protein
MLRKAQIRRRNQGLLKKNKKDLKSNKYLNSITFHLIKQIKHFDYD